MATGVLCVKFDSESSTQSRTMEDCPVAWSVWNTCIKKYMHLHEYIVKANGVENNTELYWFHYMYKDVWTHFYSSTEERTSYRFEAKWGWVNYDLILRIKMRTHLLMFGEFYRWNLVISFRIHTIGNFTWERNDITQRLKVVPCYIIPSYLTGDYFQTLRNIIAPAAPMVWQQSSLIITPGQEYSC